jgi:hypothetical protein
MSFTVNDFEDLIRILEQQPEWRARLRQYILPAELLELPQLVRELADAQRRTDERVAELAERVNQLAERVAELAEAQRRTAEQVSSLSTQVATLAEVQQRMAVDIGELRGWGTELQYERHAPAYFGRIIRRSHVLSTDERWNLLDAAVQRGLITEAESDEIVLADLLVRGRLREGQREVYLVVEVSWGLGHDDVRRARERASLLAKAGVEALAVVAGDWASDDVQQDARSSRVWLVTDGRVAPPTS